MASHIRSLCTTGFTLTLLALIPAASSSAQATAVKCKDGTTSASAGRGACSGHGGVNKTATKTEKKAVKSEEKTAKAVVKTTKGTEVTSTCADGTLSHTTGRGACSGHGGVKAAGVTSKATGAPVPARGTVTPPKTMPAAAAASTPRASARATQRASSNSAVAGSGGGEDNKAAGAIAQCKDGLYSHSKNRTGACSRHGGVARWM